MGSVHYKLARVYQALGQKENAAREFERSTAPECGSAHETREAKGTLGRSREATRILNELYQMKRPMKDVPELSTLLCSWWQGCSGLVFPYARLLRIASRRPITAQIARVKRSRKA